METVFEALSAAGKDYLDVYIGIMRYLMPILAFAMLLWCARPLFTFRREPEIWAWLCMEDGTKLPITHWENVIGRSKRSDVVIDFPTVSRNHAVITRYDDCSWTIADTDSSGGVAVNGMSEFARNSALSNSALLVGVDPSDFPGDHALAGIALQREIKI